MTFAKLLSDHNNEPTADTKPLYVGLCRLSFGH